MQSGASTGMKTRRKPYEATLRGLNIYFGTHRNMSGNVVIYTRLLP